MRILCTVTALWLVVSSRLVDAQQPITVKFQSTVPNPAIMQYAYFVGPFWGTVMSDPTRPTINLFCVDILNPISWGLEWPVNVSSLGSSSIPNTRHGTVKLDNYRQAAWLSTQFSVNSTTEWAGIQAAIWNVLNPGAPDGAAGEQYWLNQAATFSSSAASSSYNWSQFDVLTPINSAGQLHGGPQEFITSSLYVGPTTSPHVTPEPETWLLMGTGLVMIAGFAVLRGARI